MEGGHSKGQGQEGTGVLHVPFGVPPGTIALDCTGSPIRIIQNILPSAQIKVRNYRNSDLAE